MAGTQTLGEVTAGQEGFRRTVFANVLDKMNDPRGPAYGRLAGLELHKTEISGLFQFAVEEQVEPLKIPDRCRPSTTKYAPDRLNTFVSENEWIHRHAPERLVL